MATPTSAERQRGRVIDAVPDHDDRPAALLGPHGVELVGGGSLGQHAVHADDRADRFGYLGAVSGDHDNPVDAACAQRTDGPGGIGADRVVQDQDPGRLAVNCDEHRERSVQPCSPACGLRPAWRPGQAADPAPGGSR
jgi:hypothetical protein